MNRVKRANFVLQESNFYTDRTSYRNCYYCNLGCIASARPAFRAGESQGHPVREQFEAAGNRHGTISGGQQRFRHCADSGESTNYTHTDFSSVDYQGNSWDMIWGSYLYSIPNRKYTGL